MARPIIASKLIKSVRDRAFVPADSTTYQDEDILDILNEEVSQGLLATIMSLNEEHMVDHVDIPYDGGSSVVIPERAVGNKLRDVAYLRSGTTYELSRISLEELSDYNNDFGSDYADVFYIEGNEVKFVTNNIQADTIRLYFYMSPNDIIDEEECGRIATITDNGDGTTTFALSNFPSDFTNNFTMDIVGSSVPNKIKAYDIVPVTSNKNLKTVTFNTDDLPNNISQNDYICPQYTSPYLNMPSEMHPLLAQRAAIFILEALGDTEGFQVATKRLETMQNAIQTTLEDRVEGAPQKINPRHSTLTQTRFGTNRLRNRRR